MDGLHEYNPHLQNSHYPSSPVQNGITQVLAILPQVGITGTQAVDLAKLLPSDPMEPALNIMAGVQAYFQGSIACPFLFLIGLKIECLVAYKRFTDNVPLAIDYELILGIGRDITLALHKALKVGEPEGAHICKVLTQEPPNISARREELQKKLNRLNTAHMELMHVEL